MGEMMLLTAIEMTPLKRINTSGGDVLHALKREDVGYAGFGEAYLSWISGGMIKGWKRHTKMTMNIVVPVGQVRFVFRIAGANGLDEYRVEEIGVDNYARITVPPGVWFAFQGLDSPASLVMNIANIPHDPNEVERMGLDEINYAWRK
jgi:dTDP-4-dehydrorhamnose 3,5-epimerase